MTPATTGAATVAHDYLAAFHEYMHRKGLDVRPIRFPQFLDHHRACAYPPFKGWRAEDLFWGVYVDGDELIATWAAKPYLLMPGESLRQMMEHRGLYETYDEAWKLDGEAAALADGVRDLAVFEGGLCIPTHWRKTIEAEAVVNEMPLFVRMTAVDFWQAPAVWFLAKKPKLAERFRPEHLAGAVTWTKGGELKDHATRFLGVSTAPWIEERAREYLTR